MGGLVGCVMSRNRFRFKWIVCNTSQNGSAWVWLTTTLFGPEFMNYLIPKKINVSNLITKLYFFNDKLIFE